MFMEAVPQKAGLDPGVKFSLELNLEGQLMGVSESPEHTDHELGSLSESKMM